MCPTPRHRQHGAALLESLIAILVIAFGVLALIGLQAKAVASSADAKHRADASYHVDRLIGFMQMSVNRANKTALDASLNTFVHQATTSGPCRFTGTVASNATAQAIITDMGDTSKGGLPGVEDEMVQVLVDPVSVTVGSRTEIFNRVTVTLCWKAPNEPASEAAHSHTTVAYVN